MKNTFIKIATATLLALTSASAHGATVVQDTAGTSTSASVFVGESFTTPTDFLYYNLTFNFYSDAPATTPSAAGTAFLLSEPYAGAPSALSMTTPGFLTESSSSTGGVFTFNPNFVTLTDTTYYLYTDTREVVTFGDTSTSALRYVSVGTNTNYAATASAANFTLSGNRVGLPLPEPSSETALYVLSGAVGLGFVVMRRRQARA